MIKSASLHSAVVALAAYGRMRAGQRRQGQYLFTIATHARLSTVAMSVAFVLGGYAAMLPSASAEETSAPVAGVDSEEEATAQAGDGMSELIRKYDALEQELSTMRAMFVAAQIKQRESTPPPRSGSRLGELQRKALAYDALQGQIEHKNAVIAVLQAERDEARSMAAQQRRKILELTETIAAQAETIAALEKEQKALKENLDLLRLGKYEYYEIKEGDTVKSIAALPTVYGDEARHVVIRQANRGHVADLDSLVPGEVIVIPRFPASGRYEF